MNTRVERRVFVFHSSVIFTCSSFSCFSCVPFCAFCGLFIVFPVIRISLYLSALFSFHSTFSFVRTYPNLPLLPLIFNRFLLIILRMIHISLLCHDNIWYGGNCFIIPSLVYAKSYSWSASRSRDFRADLFCAISFYQQYPLGIPIFWNPFKSSHLFRGGARGGPEGIQPPVGEP